MTAPAFLDVLEELISTVVEPAAADVDATGTFPRAAVTALGSALETARARAYEAVSHIHFENCHYRRDIALNAVVANMSELL